jgi:CheY-like chemotaxis protein
VQIRFDIVDTGIGTPLAEQGRLFQSFTQLDASTTRRFGGTGLGLAISRRLTELMGGRIGVSSAAGAGSRFWFTLRLKKDTTDYDLPPLRPLGGRRALVVEPHPLVRGLVEGVLRDLGASVVTADSASASTIAADIVVADRGTPVVPGRQVTVMLGERLKDGTDMAGATYLPRPIRAGALRRTLQAHLVTQAAAPVQSAASASGRGRVLLAEDNAVNQRVAERLLQKLGYSVVLVANGEEAIAAASEGSFDAILMDCQMPIVDGFEATGAIRAMESDAVHVPIIALTAEALAGDRERCLRAGMDDYLSKPVRIEQLQATLARWMPRHGVEIAELQTTHR